MLFKASKKAPYLYRHKDSASYYFRRSIPIDLRAIFGKREVKISLKTSHKVRAVLLHNYYASMVAVAFATGAGDMIKKLEIGSLTKGADGSIKIEGLKTDPNNPESELAFLKAFGIVKDDDPIMVAPEPQSGGPRFCELVGKYLQYAKLPEKTRIDDEAIFKLFMELYDDPILRDIDHAMLTNFQETIETLPANFRKMYPNLTGKEIVRMSHANKKLLSPHSVNKYLGRLGMAFKYAVNHGMMKENYAAGKRVKDPVKARDKRRPFTTGELKDMFENSKLLSAPYTESKKPDLFWLLLIAVFTGMRLSEICQLEPSDIRQVDGIWVFDINDDRELKSCKTSGSKRLVPVHSVLLKCGLIDFVKARQKQVWLFGWKYHDKNGWSHNSGKAANYFIQKTSSIPEQSIHCFRHTVGDVLMKSRSVSKELQEAILGHAHDGQSYARYGKGFAIDVLRDGVENIQYDLSLSHLFPQAI